MLPSKRAPVLQVEVILVYAAGLYGLLLSLCAVAAAQEAETSTDRLLALLPERTAAVVVVPDLAANWNRISSTPLAKRVAELPSVVEVLATHDLAKVQRDLESLFGVPIDRIREDLLGESLVFAVWHEDDAPAEKASGVLLTQMKDAALGERVIHALQQADQDATLTIETQSYRGQSYHTRSFKDRTRPSDSWAFLPGNRFIWSNSTELIRQAIGRSNTQGPSIRSHPQFQRVFNRIVTNDPVMWAYVHPDFLRRFDRETHTAPEDAINREFRRLADSVEGIGCSFRWNERLQLQLTFAMEPGSAGLLAGLSSPNARDTSQIELRLSPRTVMIARGFFDFPAAYEAFLGLLEKSDPAASVAMNELLKGFLRGEDPKTRILPHVGPEVVVGIEAPASGETRCPWVVAVPLRGDQEVERAVENAIATVMAAAALDTKTTPRARFETRQVNGGSLRVLDREGRTLGVAIQSDQFAAGSPAERVAEWLGVDGGASEQSRAWAILGRGSSASIVADLVAIETAISTNRAALIERMIKIEGRNEKDAARDLDQASAMIRLFRAGALELDWAPKDAMLELRVSLQSR